MCKMIISTSQHTDQRDFCTKSLRQINLLQVKQTNKQTISIYVIPCHLKIRSSFLNLVGIIVCKHMILATRNSILMSVLFPSSLG